jgi:hypothetical protein
VTLGQRACHSGQTFPEVIEFRSIRNRSGPPVCLVSRVVVCFLHVRYPPANMTYNIFIMNGKSLWQNSQDKDLKKFMGKPKHLKYNSFV